MRPSSDRALLAAARQAAHYAWAPYSSFPVGAAVLTVDGTIVTGCNVENAAYGSTICAERNAATTLVAQPRPRTEDLPRIHTVAIVGLKAAPCWPCGTCRQVLREFQCQRVVVEDEHGEPCALPFEEILPHSFGPDALGDTEPTAPAAPAAAGLSGESE